MSLHPSKRAAPPPNGSRSLPWVCQESAWAAKTWEASIKVAAFARWVDEAG